MKKKMFYLISSLFTGINKKIAFPQGRAADIETNESNVIFYCLNRKLVKFVLDS